MVKTKILDGIIVIIRNEEIESEKKFFLGMSLLIKHRDYTRFEMYRQAIIVL